MKKYFYPLLGLVLIAMDQASKYLSAVHGRIFRNYLFAFSLPVPWWLMYLFYAGILATIAWYVLRRHRAFSGRESFAWTLVLAGSISNISERLFTGYVKDFIYLFTGVFNLADFYIILGIILLLLIRSGRRS
jgi:lipoprotein signal peptidase